MRKFYTRRNIIISLGFSLAVVGFFVWYTYRNMQRESADSNNVTKTLNVLKVIEDVKDDMQDMETAQRGFIISGNDKFLDSYYLAKGNLRADTVGLKRLSALYPSRQRLIDKILSLVREKVAFAEYSIATAKVDRDSTHLRVQSGIGKDIMDRFRQSVQQIETEDRKVLRDSNNHREKIAKRTSELFITLACIFIVVLAFLIFKIHKELIQREANEKRMSYLAGMVEQAGEAIMSASVDFILLSWNKGAEEMYGFTSSEVIGKKVYEVLSSERSDAERVAVAEMLRHSGYFMEEMKYKKRNGQWIFVTASYTVMRNKKQEIIGCTLVHRDITDKKLSEQLLTEFNQKLNAQVQEKTAAMKIAMERFRIIARATNDVIWDVDLSEGGPVWWNENLTRKFGYTFSDEFTNNTFWEDHIHPDDKERVVSNINKVLEDSDQNTWSDEYRFQKADGTYLTVYDRSYIMRDDIGRAFRMIGSMADVTDLLETRKELRRSEEEIIKTNARFQIISKATSDIVWDWDLESESLWWNDNYYSKLGYTKGSEFVSINNWRESIHPTERERIYSKITSAINSGEMMWRDEYRYKKADGSYLYFFDRAHILRDSEGKAYKLIGSMVDITDLYTAQAKLRESEEQYRTLIEQASDAILIYSVEGEIYSFNASAAAMTGYTVDEFSKLKLSDFFVGNIISDPAKYRELMDGNSVTVYRQFKRKDGSLCDVEIVAKKVNDNRILSFGRDVTDRRKAEEVIKNNELLFRTLTANAPVGIFQTDAGGKTIFVNETWLEYTGLKFEEALGDGWFNAVHPDDRKQLNTIWNERSVKGLPSVSEYRLVDKNGNIRWVSGNAVPLYNNFGEISGHIGTISDTTERKTAEEKYRTLVEQAIDAIALYDDSGKILDVNTGAVNLLGYSREELKQMSISQILTQQEMELNPVRYDVLSDGESTVKQRMMWRKDGTAVSTEVRSQKLPDGRFLSVIRDLTDRFEAQKKIQVEKELSDKLINSLPGVFYWYDESRKFLRWNKQFETVTGYSASEVLKMHPLDFFEGDEAEYMKHRIETVFAEGYGDAEAHFVSKQGAHTPYYFKAIRIEFEGRPSLLGTGVDISERKKAEAELRRSEEKYKLLFRNSPLPMWVYELETFDILDVNEAALRHYGYNMEEFMSLSVLDLRPNDERDLFLKSTPAKVENAIFFGIWKHVTKSGQIIDVEITGHDIIYNNRRGRLIVSVDVTDKIRNEEEIRKYSDELRKLADHLNHIREEERTHIAREIHDELGQHLTVLKMDVSWLNKKVAPEADQQVKEKLQDLLKMLDGTVRTVRRISSDLRPSLLDDLGLVAAIEWQLGEFEKRSDIKTHFKLSGNTFNLANDIKTGMFRIFQESLTNVARHAEAKNVKVEIQYTDKIFILRIEDDGKGFDNEKVSATRTLGILGMKERAAMIGGTYSISSHENKGTVVLVTVPFVTKLNTV